jgi:GT2 family glycosyltransferase
MVFLDVGVVVLNWNGMDDTIACLDSIYSQEGIPRYLVLVDNGSTDGSIDAVCIWLEGHPRLRAHRTHGARPDGGASREFEIHDPMDASDAEEVRHHGTFAIVENGENRGFSAGNNIGIRFLLERGVPLIMLLNNDTIVGPGALSDLVRTLEKRPATQCLVPQIRFWEAKDRIWNCGGEWTWLGTIRYRHAGQSGHLLDARSPFPVTFVTGCALILRAEWLEANGLLCERFFFGEEDVELSWRLRSSGGEMLCSPTSIIYHKVSASISKVGDFGDLPKIYGQYLNRLISLKMIWGRGPRWHFRRLLVLVKLGWTLRSRFEFSVGEVLGTMSDLIKDSSEKDGISREFFFWMIKEKFRGRASGREA